MALIEFAAPLPIRSLSDLTEFLATPTQIAPGTLTDRGKALRAAGMLSVGQSGPNRGARMTTGDAVNMTIAAVVQHKRGADVGATVARLLTSPFTSAMISPTRERPSSDPARVASFIHGLSLARRCATFGDAMNSLVDDHRCGAFAEWADNSPYSLVAEINDKGLPQILLDRPVADEAVVFSYGLRCEPDVPMVQHFVRIEQALFQRIAAALGPP